MKLDLDLVRDILLRLEEMPPRAQFDYQFDGYADEEVQYHLYLLNDAGLVEVQKGSSGKREHYVPRKITWAGQEFLTNSKNGSIWTKAVSMAKEKGLESSYDVVKALLVKLALRALGL